MTVSINRPEDAVNAALARIGYRLRVNSILDGTRAAALALQIYGQTRDALLRDGNWGFAQKTIACVASGTPPTAPWSFAFVYPADCLRVRNLFPASYAQGDQNNPLRVLYQVADATGTTKYILTNEQTPVIVYTARVTSPLLWDALFAEALIVELAKRLAPALASLDVEKVVTADEQQTMPKAEMTVG
jgi:hypothetical protein